MADDSLTGADLADLHLHISAATDVPAGTDANGSFNSETATAICAPGEDLFNWSVRWTTLVGNEEVSTMNVEPNFGVPSVTVRAGTDEATQETFVVEAWCS